MQLIDQSAISLLSYTNELKMVFTDLLLGAQHEE